MFDPQKIIAVFDICPSPAVIWPHAGYNIISVTYYSIFVVWNQLKCFFPPEKLSFAVLFHAAVRRIFSAARIVSFSCLRSIFLRSSCIFFSFFEASSAFFTIIACRFCAFIQLYLTLRTEFSLHSIQNIRFFVRHFLFLRFRSCAGQKEMQQSPAGSAPVRGLQFIRRFPGPAARSCCP